MAMQKNGCTALHYAIQKGHFALFKVLLEAGAGIDVLCLVSYEKASSLTAAVNTAVELLEHNPVAMAYAGTVSAPPSSEK